MTEERIIEFMKIKSLGKFSHNGYITFFDGHFVSNWFNANKEEILNSNDKNCKVIQEQYKIYLKQIKERKDEISYASLRQTKNSMGIAKEFMEINDSKKFDINSNIMLSNGMSSFDWFAKNVRYVFSSTHEVYQTIKKQYCDMHKKRKLISLRKDKYYFYKEKSLYKFNEYSNIKMPSNTLSGIWFLENKKYIFNSNDPLDVEIQNQYRKYENYYNLELEFYYEQSELKFDEDSNVRFSSRALMNIWWEANKEKILSSSFYLDVLIQKQYNNYLNSMNGETFKKKL